ncbi:hypothetical protein ElyMa_003047200 [Elysia marginata]|uniref:Transmembrane protein n=1 Tax=Elysia marginata TaxID=1093978 RepID=A0AAV4ILS7_9GAST|nr:hypothetical protein ElyMa_003047200 [Elysia marginata]
MMIAYRSGLLKEIRCASYNTVCNCRTRVVVVVVVVVVVEKVVVLVVVVVVVEVVVVLVWRRGLVVDARLSAGRRLVLEKAINTYFFASLMR